MQVIEKVKVVPEGYNGAGRFVSVGFNSTEPTLPRPSGNRQRNVRFV